MKAEFFHAVCPLEIGDTVAIKLDNKAQQTEAMPEALYIATRNSIGRLQGYSHCNCHRHCNNALSEIRENTVFV